MLGRRDVPLGRVEIELFLAEAGHADCSHVIGSMSVHTIALPGGRRVENGERLFSDPLASRSAERQSSTRRPSGADFGLAARPRTIFFPAVAAAGPFRRLPPVAALA